MTMNQPGFRVFALISVGFALNLLSRQFELSQAIFRPLQA
jgi:hypothetical protein